MQYNTTFGLINIDLTDNGVIIKPKIDPQFKDVEDKIKEYCFVLQQLYNEGEITIEEILARLTMHDTSSNITHHL